MVSNSWQQKSQRHISYGPTELKLYARRNMLNGVYLDLKLVGFRISIGLVWKMLCITITSTILCDAKWEKIRRAALWCGDVAQTRAECNTGILSAQLWVQQTTCFWSKATPDLLTLPCVWTFTSMQLPDEASDQQSKCPRDAESSSHGCTHLQEPKLLGGNTTPLLSSVAGRPLRWIVYGSAVRVQTRHLASFHRSPSVVWRWRPSPRESRWFPHSVDREHTPDMSCCRVKIPKRTLSQSISIAEGRRGEW